MYLIRFGERSKFFPCDLIIIVAVLFFLFPSVPIISAFASSSIHTDPSQPNGSYVKTLTSPNAQDGGLFGYSVASSGNIVAVGAAFETARGYSDAGHAYIFNVVTGKLISTLTSPNAQTNGYFGAAVAVAGNTVVVGAWDETVSGYIAAGRAYTYSSETGKLTDTLTSPNAQTDGSFGFVCAASGKTIIIGAPFETVSGYSDAGHAYTFSANTGKLIGTFASPNTQSAGLFGYSVGISNSTIIVGAPLENASGYSAAGHAYTFNAKTGALISTLTSPNAQTTGYFGWSAGASNSTVVVGALTETARGYYEAGHAYTFNAETGALISTLTSPHAQQGGQFGYAVSISSNIVVVGAPPEDTPKCCHAGHAYTFNAETGALIHTLTSPNEQNLGYFGFSVAASSNIILVGAPYETASGYSEAGHAYVYGLNNDG